MVLSPALPIPQLKRQNLVKKVEVQSDQVTIYLDQVRWATIAAVLQAQGCHWGGGTWLCLTLGLSPS